MESSKHDWMLSGTATSLQFLHLSVYRTSYELLQKIVRGKKYREMYEKLKTQLDAFWHNYIPPIFFLKSFS